MVNTSQQSRQDNYKRRYEKIKNDPELYRQYRERNNLNARKRYLKNREKIKAQKIKYYREMRSIAREMGNCIYCFKENDDPKYSGCSKCRERNRMNTKKYNNKKNGN